MEGISDGISGALIGLSGFRGTILVSPSMNEIIEFAGLSIGAGSVLSVMGPLFYPELLCVSSGSVSPSDHVPLSVYTFWGENDPFDEIVCIC